ncbi:hypothetical protein [Tsuneonella sp. HG222]
MPKMTRSHYNLIADTVAEFGGIAGITPEQHMAMCKRMAANLAGTNSQFKAERFRDRCAGIKVGR